MALTPLRGNAVAGRTFNGDGRVVRFVREGFIRQSFLEVSPGMMEFGFVRAISAPANPPAIPAQIHFGIVRAISRPADPPAIPAQIHLSRGRPLPGGDVPDRPASTILMSAEDGRARREEQASGRHECDLWLREILSSGSVPHVEILTAGARNGFTRETLRRTKDRVGAESCRQGVGPGSRLFWRLKLPGALASAGSIGGT
jgi:hypothetical protein